MATKASGLPVNAHLQRLISPHVDSFNYFLEQGLPLAVSFLDPVTITHNELLGKRAGTQGEEGGGDHPAATFHLAGVEIGRPAHADSSLDDKVFPSECREGSLTYSAPFYAKVVYRDLRGREQSEQRFQTRLGHLPIMVKSKKCRLNGMTQDQLIEKHEEPNELGGYFIINGLEKIIRLLIVPRRNSVTSVYRPSLRRIGGKYTPYAVIIRCARPDQTTQTITMHHLTDGNCTVRFILGKQEYFLPVTVLLKALCDTSDREIAERLTGSNPESTFLADSAELLLQEAKNLRVYTRLQALAFIGSRFRVSLRTVDSSMTDVEVGELLLRKYILVHLVDNRDKFELLLFMILKLLSFVRGDSDADNADAPQHQEVLLPGHIYLMILKERLQEWLYAVKGAVLKDLRAPTSPPRVLSDTLFRRAMEKTFDVGQRMKYFLSTGNLVSESGLDLMQTSGYVIIAEKLNYLRYLSHFCCIHRGAFFATMKTTAVRKLLPESWGFLCPVHTPDGAPCGLLNHLAAPCAVQTDVYNTPDTVHYKLAPHLVESSSSSTSSSSSASSSASPASKSSSSSASASPYASIVEILGSLGMQPLGINVTTAAFLTVILDGRPVGYVAVDMAETVAARLRFYKALSTPPSVAARAAGGPVNPNEKYSPLFLTTLKVGDDAAGSGHHLNEIAVPPHLHVPMTLEIGLIKSSEGGGYPGLFLFTTPARFLRPVRHLASGRIELLSSFEQVYMSIACLDDDVRPTTSHQELMPTNMLSLVANLTPFSDFNQSPRNMYQCQMGKQSMATPMHSYVHRTDNKLYRIQTPQAPICQTRYQRHYDITDYPSGANAVVAVISYTGYDMEDAMIINKSAYERGFGHGSVYKTEDVELLPGGRTRGHTFFDNGLRAGNGIKYCPDLELDGLPAVGQRMSQGQPYYCVYDELKGEYKVTNYKSMEPSVIDEIRVLGQLPSSSSSSSSSASSTTSLVGAGGGAADKAEGDSKDGAATGSGKGGKGKGSGGFVLGPEHRVIHVKIKLRFNRNPIIGDKFSSRHGQKGVLSKLWPLVDMPFSESGMTPDVIINPHAFPSRMTIGMLVESMAGKAGSCHGMLQDATPFRFDEHNTAVDFFGQQLLKAGYNYYGNEPLYSGVYGTEFKADIYFGVVYYQRLRHMVSDKHQVRATGRINALTRQPVKGRKLGGGIRLGEMERDSLLAHGAAFMLKDRLMNCSDTTRVHVCQGCGSFLAPVREVDESGFPKRQKHGVHSPESEVSCRNCATGARIAVINLPYVVKYLAAELAAMNIKISLIVQ